MEQMKKNEKMNKKKRKIQKMKNEEQMHSERRHFVLLCGGAARWGNHSLRTGNCRVTVHLESPTFALSEAFPASGNVGRCGVLGLRDQVLLLAR